MDAAASRNDSSGNLFQNLNVLTYSKVTMTLIPNLPTDISQKEQICPLAQTTNTLKKYLENKGKNKAKQLACLDYFVK